MTQQKRKHIRFKPDPGTIAWVDSTTEGSFTRELPALVRQESAKGAGLVLLDAPHLQVGQACRIQIGNLEPLRAAIRWNKVLEPGVWTLGLEYLE
ncbi:MAG: hypothetical protein NDJ89_16020 [Oligoflexia bacterium]|nr:hypothetical protein [Oligoflexia bacterium]